MLRASGESRRPARENLPASTVPAGAARERYPMADDEAQPLSEEFNVWLAGQAGTLGENHLGTVGVELSKGNTFKYATLTLHGDSETGEISHKRLKVATAPRDPGSGGFDFDNPVKVWIGQDDQVERLRAFLAKELTVGRYRIIAANSPTGGIVELLEGDAGRSVELLAALTDTLSPEVLADALRTTTSGQGAAELAVIAQRRAVLDHLDALLDDPGTTETALHAVLKDQSWIFGSRFVSSLRTNLLPLDNHDFALLAADGSLHIIELKGPNIPALVKRPREHWTVGTQVHEAAMQAANYIRTADEQGPAITTMIRDDLNLDVDLRRTFATVVIGHPKHQTEHPMLNEHSVPQAFRTYNAHVTRVEVLTYDQLVDTARRSLTFVDGKRQRRPEGFGQPFDLAEQS